MKLPEKKPTDQKMPNRGLLKKAMRYFTCGTKPFVTKFMPYEFAVLYQTNTEFYKVSVDAQDVKKGKEECATDGHRYTPIRRGNKRTIRMHRKGEYTV